MNRDVRPAKSGIRPTKAQTEAEATSRAKTAAEIQAQFVADYKREFQTDETPRRFFPADSWQSQDQSVAAVSSISHSSGSPEFLLSVIPAASPKPQLKRKKIQWLI